MTHDTIPLSLYHLRLLHKVLGLHAPECCATAERETPGLVALTREELHRIFVSAKRETRVSSRGEPEAIGEILAGDLRPPTHGVEFRVLGDERRVPRRPATPTSVAMSEEHERESVAPEPPSPVMPEEERERWIALAASRGADEHRLRCDLAARGEELETATRRSARAIIRELEAEHLSLTRESARNQQSPLRSPRASPPPSRPRAAASA